jgi:hypothetical protein
MTSAKLSEHLLIEKDKPVSIAINIITFVLNIHRYENFHYLISFLNHDDEARINNSTLQIILSTTTLKSPSLILLILLYG